MYSKEKIFEVFQEIVEGSRDISPYVVIAQPRRDKSETAAQKLEGAHGIHIDILGISHGFIDISGEKVDVARNYLIEQVLNSGAKYLFFVGEDTVVPYNGYKILHETAEKNPGSIVCGVYYIKLSDPMVTVKNGNWLSIPDVSPGQLIEAWTVGMDCMLIPVEVLQKLKAEDPEIPFTCISSGSVGGFPFIGEDNFFLHRIHKLGVKVLVNTDVQCLHVDLATGKYTAHPSVNLDNYYTNIKITEPLTLEDKKYIDQRWLNRLPKGTGESLNLSSKLAMLAENNQPVKFNMGCGPHNIEGYIGVDKYSKNADIQQDLLELDLPDNSADEIFASHVIEHIPQHRIPELLPKWYGILKPNGKLILETPNLQELCKSFEEASEEQRRIITFCIYGAFVDDHSEETLKNGTKSPHLWGFYPELLEKQLLVAGFKNIEVLPAQGPHPGINFRIEATK